VKRVFHLSGSLVQPAPQQDLQRAGCSLLHDLNYATHKHPKVLAWLSRHPRWIFHFTATSASWLNAVENFFSKMTQQRILRGVFRSIVDLQSAINAYLPSTMLTKTVCLDPIRKCHPRQTRPRSCTL
jgi:hypothetical protein